MYLKYDKLVINQVTYVWDEEMNGRRKLADPDIDTDGGITQDNEKQDAPQNDRMITRTVTKGKRMNAKKLHTGQARLTDQEKTANGASK